MSNEKYETYNTKVTNFGTYREITHFHTSQVRKAKSDEHRGGRNKNSVISDEAQEERTKAQHYKIKRKIRHYILANDFQFFVTFTIDPQKGNSLDYDTAKSILLKWCETQRKMKGKFDYIFIPEFHKSGRVHFHGVLGNCNFELIEAVNPKTGKVLKRNGRQVYNLPVWKYGFTDVEIIEDKERTSSYMTKYVTKELMSNKEMFGKKRYFPSRGLKVPEITFENRASDEFEDFTPNYGLISKNYTGEKVIDKAIYKLSVDSETGEIVQKDRNSLIKII